MQGTLSVFADQRRRRSYELGMLLKLSAGDPRFSSTGQPRDPHIRNPSHTREQHLFGVFSCTGECRRRASPGRMSAGASAFCPSLVRSHTRSVTQAMYTLAHSSEHSGLLPDATTAILSPPLLLSLNTRGRSPLRRPSRNAWGGQARKLAIIAIRDARRDGARRPTSRET